MKRLTRRQILNRIGWICFSAVVAMLGGLLFDVLRSTSRFGGIRWRDVGDVNRFPTDRFTPVPALRIAVVRQQNQLAVISLECPHLGCVVNPVDEGFFCPCHGSEFGAMGELYSGPAEQSLWWKRVKVRRGRLLVRYDDRQEGARWVTLPNLGGKA